MPLSSSQAPITVLLLNLGGPETLADVEPFLFNLFSDRKIIRLGPAFLQKFIARRIARKRAPKSMESYRLIGGGSPLAAITGQQAAALERRLAAHGSFQVKMVMRYWSPRAAEVLAGLHTAGQRRVVALPLYPHYSVATTGSSLDDLRSAAARFTPDFSVREIEAWPSQPRYIGALADTIRQGLARFGNEPVTLLYSAHSLPVKFIEEGDPYVDHLHETIAAVEAITGVKGRLCYQSRSGPVEWLAPSTPEMLETVAGEGCRNLLVVPISFVSDHVETLYELDIQYRDLASTLGMRLERTDSLNTRPDFIEALAELTLEAASGL